MDDLKPGRELDALVAEKVMGEENITRDTLHGDETEPCYIVSPGDGLIAYLAVLPYSTDISAAWKVVEKLWSHGSPVCLTAAGEGWSIYKPLYVVMKWSQPYVTAPTAPHVICLAALKAVGATK